MYKYCIAIIDLNVPKQLENDTKMLSNTFIKIKTTRRYLLILPPGGAAATSRGHTMKTLLINCHIDISIYFVYECMNTFANSVEVETCVYM